MFRLAKLPANDELGYCWLDFWLNGPHESGTPFPIRTVSFLVGCSHKVDVHIIIKESTDG